MESETNSYQKGELVPAPGTYRCTVCGELWTTDQANIRFPPCDVDKQGQGRWVLVQQDLA